MRSMILALLTLTTTSALHAMAALQGAPPTPPPQTAPPPDACFEFHPVKIDGVMNRWSRILVGGKYITGCLGAPVQCYAPVWIRC